MDPYLSGEDLVIKARKPYTITKQRERWTEEEHSRFLEALKLYGRAWQRIEEHIGTKTAVQIRSHAQKFFTKLEKEATVKGVGQAHDIEIPPPRPKRKPNNPYPRKTCIAPTLQLGLKDGNTSEATSILMQENIMNSENESEKLDDDETVPNKECNEVDGRFEALNLEIAVPCASSTSAGNSSFISEAAMTSGAFRQYIPVTEESSNLDETTATLVTNAPATNLAEHYDEKHLFNENGMKVSEVMDPCLSCEESSHGEIVTEPKQVGNCGHTSITNDQAYQNYPHHVPVHILGGNFGTSVQHIPMDAYRSTWIHADQNLFINPAASATSEYNSSASRAAMNQPFLNYQHFFTPVQNPEDYQKFLHLQSTFSNLIMTSLTQNAAVYNAANCASTSWPWLNMGAPVDPSGSSSDYSQTQPISPTSNMQAIAAATVAAATAWWTSNGLIPLCHHPGFMCSPTVAPQVDECKNVNGEATEKGHDPALGNQGPDAGFSELQNLTAKSPASSSSDCETSETEKLNGGLNDIGTVDNDENTDSLLHDLNKSKNMKQLDRSSCGSNTTSGSEVEPDTTDKHAKEKEERHIITNEESDAVPPIADLFSRRGRSYNNITDSWKEVSEEGRLAFQALFSREVLPQSFAPSDDINHKRDGLFTEALSQSKLKTSRTGFKPYKRCSMEAKETRISSNRQEEEKDPKKLRLEMEANGSSIS